MEKKINKKKIIIQGLVVTVVFGFGYCIGVKAGGQKFGDALDMLARTGITTSKIIDGEKYILSVTQE